MANDFIGDKKETKLMRDTLKAPNYVMNSFKSFLPFAFTIFPSISVLNFIVINTGLEVFSTFSFIVVEYIVCVVSFLCL